MAKLVPGSAFVGLSGKFDTAVLVRTPGGTVMRPRIVPHNPKTPKQQAWRAAMRAAGQAYRTLSLAQHEAWQAYARSTVPAGQSLPNVAGVFVALAAKVVQIDPSAEIPLDPPTVPFYGEAINVQVADEVGWVQFTATGPNAEGVATELLVQKIAAPFNSAPISFYRSQRFVTFEPGVLSAYVELPPGWYACAVRFVRPATGQCTGVLPVGVARSS